MGVLLICPHCRDRIPLASKACPVCGADLRDLPREDRCYFLAAPPRMEMVPRLTPVAAEVVAVEEFPVPQMPDVRLPEDQELSLCEALDRILTKGAVLYGEVMLSVADIDLVYLGLQVILASVETARGFPSPLGKNLFEKSV